MGQAVILKRNVVSEFLPKVGIQNRNGPVDAEAVTVIVRGVVRERTEGERILVDILGVMQQRLNEIKDREDFRPVAPVVLEEDAGEWFENASYSPYMLFVYNVKPDKADKIPAVRHVDNRQ